MKMFRFVFLLLLAVFPNLCAAEVIPLTYGDLEKYNALPAKDKMSFLVDFYKKNKAVGATDGEILNEIVKIDGIQNNFKIRMFAKISSQLDNYDSYIRMAVDDINRQIRENNPGRDDLLIDPDDSSTWTNIQYMAVGDRNLKDYLWDFTKSKYFSDPVYTPSGAFMLAACARTDAANPNLLMGAMLLQDPSAVILQQREGERPAPVTLDFSASENVVVDAPDYPLQDELPELNATGYVKEAVLPFTVHIQDTAKPAIVRATAKATVCRDGVCAVEHYPQVEYEIPESYLESSVCTELNRTVYNAPARRNAKIKLKDAVLKKEQGEVFLIAAVEKPFSFAGEPKLRIANELGLHFEDAFVGSEGSGFFYRARLKNPEKIADKKEIPLTLTFYNQVKADEFPVNAAVGKDFAFNFSTSIAGCFAAFAGGFLTLLLTPLLTAVLMLMYQMFNADNRTAERTGDFFDGLADSAKWSVCGAAALVLIGHWAGRFAFFGVQFKSPWLNGVYIAAFSAAAVILPKLFDDAFVSRLPFVKSDNPRKTAGFLTGLICAGLLLFTPEIAFFNELLELLSRSPVVYTLLFLSAAASVFVLVILLNEAAIKSGKEIKFLSKAMVAPLFVQIVLLAVTLGLEIGAFRTGIAIVFAVIVGLVFKYFDRKKTAAAALLASLAAVPVLPTEYDFNTFGAADFDEQVLKQAVADGKSVYLNVTESGCLICQSNRLVMMYKGGRDEIKQGNLIVMGVSYAHPFVRRLLEGTGQDILPANILFSPKTPSGKVLPSVLGPWRAPDIVREYVQPLSKSTN